MLSFVMRADQPKSLTQSPHT